MRLSNSSSGLDTENTKFGKQMHSYRDALVKSIVSKLLSDKTFQCLIRPPEDPLDTVEREDEFYDTYQSAAYLSTHMCAQHESVKVHNLSGVMPRFDRQSRTAVADYLHFLKDGSTRLDGHPVLAITQPAVFAYGGLLDEEKMSRFYGKGDCGRQVRFRKYRAGRRIGERSGTKVM